MNQTKIIFFDIDGTLIDMKKKQISDKTVEMLQRLKENNIIICIATGRSPVTLPRFEKIAFDAFLTYNGSYCYNRKETIFSNPLCSEDVQSIITNAAEIGRPVSVATKDRVAANGRDQDLVDYYEIAKVPVEVADDFDELVKGEVYQMMLGCRETDYPQLLKNVRHARITAWWDRAGDVIPAEGGKGVGVEKILEYYRLDRSEAMAFGDGNNDIEMLQAVGCGVAMANASDKLKEIADDVCGDVTDDGIYHYCTSHHLI